MSHTRYRAGRIRPAEMACCAQQFDDEYTNAQTLDRVKAALLKAIQENVTDKQREYLLRYYGQGKNMIEIGQELGVDKSTVSRTIKRGEARLRRCLRYGAKQFPADDGGSAIRGMTKID